MAGNLECDAELLLVCSLHHCSDLASICPTGVSGREFDASSRPAARVIIQRVHELWGHFGANNSSHIGRFSDSELACSRASLIHRAFFWPRIVHYSCYACFFSFVLAGFV